MLHTLSTDEEKLMIAAYIVLDPMVLKILLVLMECILDGKPLKMFIKQT